MKVNIVGLGYIGLPTALMFAKYDLEVVGVDTSPSVVTKLNRGQATIEEPGVEKMLQKALDKKKFRASFTPEEADVFIVAVPTPNKSDTFKSCDLSYVKQAVQSVLPYLQAGNTLIIESTISPRTTEDHLKPIVEQAGFTVGKDIYLVHCPERVLPGKIIHELIYNNRIVGGITPRCAEKAASIYAHFVQGEIIQTTAAVAEMCKLMENTFRDVNIALANELVKVGNALHIDALEVIRLANLHPRVHLHQPGPGVGGHCLAVDPYFIAAEAPLETPLIQQARAINTSMPDYVVEKVLHLLEKIQGKKVAIFGLTYKGNVDDIRESPAMEIYEKLNNQPELSVTAYDPHVSLPFVEQNLKIALHGADIALILTDHHEFIGLDTQLHLSGKKTILIDTKNIVKKADYSLATLYQVRHLEKETPFSENVEQNSHLTHNRTSRKY